MRIKYFLLGIVVLTGYGILAFYNTTQAITNFLYGNDQDQSVNYFYTHHFMVNMYLYVV